MATASARIRPLAELGPREAMYKRYWSRIQERQKRLDPGVLTALRVRTDQPAWVDYYPKFPGTVIEKVVFSALVARGITFYFGAFWGDMPFTEKVEHYRPDFLLPEYRIIIETYGYYWHGLEGSYEADALRAAMFVAAGYKFYVLWDYEIYADPFGCLDKIPELRNPATKTRQVFVAERPFDPSASLKAQRRKYPKIVRTRQKLGKDQVISSWQVWMSPNPPVRTRRTERFAVFGGMSSYDEEYLDSLTAYSAKWREYVASLGKFFGDYPGAGHYYPELYKYWATWAGWWNKWQRLSDSDWLSYFQQLEEFFNAYPDSRGRYLKEYQEWLSWKRTGARRAW